MSKEPVMKVLKVLQPFMDPIHNTFYPKKDRLFQREEKDAQVLLKMRKKEQPVVAVVEDEKDEKKGAPVTPATPSAPAAPGGEKPADPVKRK